MSSGLSVVGFVLAFGAGFYLYTTAKALEGDALQPGMRLLAAAAFLIVISAFFDLLSDVAVLPVYDTLHYFVRIIFIGILFVGARSIVLAWRKLDISLEHQPLHSHQELAH